MAVSPAQLEAIISTTGTANLVTGAATVVDDSNYGSIGIATPDTVKVLLRIYDSTMSLVYENTGFAAGSFASPDLEPLLGTDTYSFTLPTNPDGTYKTGNYTINMKIQCVDDGETVVIQPTTYLNYCNCCNDIVINVTPNVTYNTAIVSIIDNTQYGNYITLSRTMTLYPPQVVEAAQSTSAQTLVWVPTPPNTAPFTGTWQWKISSTITYIDQTTSAQTTCLITGRGTFEVEQNQLCKVLCLMNNFRTSFYANAGKKNIAPFEINWLLAGVELTLAIEASACGRPQTQITKYVNKIYDLLGIDPDCDCDCTDGTSQPLVPTSSINGTNGTNGATILNGSGVPDNSIGSSGDYYVDKSTQNWYTKVGSVWTFLFNSSGSKGDTGAQGSTGAAGTNGASVLTNQYPSLATLGTSYESLADGRTPYVLPANTLGRNGDKLKIHAFFTTNSSTTTGQAVRVTFNGNSFVFPATFPLSSSTQCNAIAFDIQLTRVSNTAIKYESEVTFMATNLLSKYVLSKIQTIPISQAGLNLTTTAYDIDVQGDSVVIGDISCLAFCVEHLIFGTSTSTNGAILVDKFTTSTGVYTYSRPLLNGRLIAMVVYGNISLDSTQYTLVGADWTLTDTTFPPDNSTEVTIFYY